MELRANITKRVRRRTLKSGEIIKQTRYVLSYKDPVTQKRRQTFFERRVDAEQRRNELVLEVGTGAYQNPNYSPTVSEAVEHWLRDREGEVKATSLADYRRGSRMITGPLLRGAREDRVAYGIDGTLPPNPQFLPLLGDIKIVDLTTAQIREWNKTIRTEVGEYTARRMFCMLRTVLQIVAEDFNIRPPLMPRRQARRSAVEKKTILTPEQVSTLLQHAEEDEERGIYYAFPFLTGVRSSEQLGLLWSEVDLEANVIRIRRIQERDGTLTETTKTEAGGREIPISPRLRRMLKAWRLRCPRKEGEPHRVFPSIGYRQKWPLPRIKQGGPLIYANFRRFYWANAFKKMDLPYVTPHSARHTFISSLQAEGVEVGLVAKLAGHANPSVTLGHYTQAVRGGESAIKMLDSAFQ